MVLGNIRYEKFLWRLGVLMGVIFGGALIVT